MGGISAVISGGGHYFEVPLNMLYDGGLGLSAVAGWLARWGCTVESSAATTVNQGQAGGGLEAQSSCIDQSLHIPPLAEPLSGELLVARFLGGAMD